MNTLRELTLILSCFTWLGAGIYWMFAVIATDSPSYAANPVGLHTSVYVFALGLAVFILASLFWKKKKDH